MAGRRQKLPETESGRGKWEEARRRGESVDLIGFPTLIGNGLGNWFLVKFSLVSKSN